MSFARRPAIAALVFLATLATAAAQIEVRMEPETRTFVAHSPVNLKVTIINRSASDLTLRGPSPGVSWLNFRITNNKGDLITTRPGGPMAPPLTVGASKSVSLKVNLNSAYPVDRFGNYQVMANAYDPDAGRFVSSAPQMITIDVAKPIWKQTAGLPDGSKIEYALLSYRGFDKTYLYFQLTNAETGFVRKTYRLGEMVRYRAPQAAIDRERRMHVLYQGAPRQYIHDLIGTDGTFIKRSLHDEAKGSRPDLVQSPDGHVQVSGGVDPEIEKKEKRKKLEDLVRIRSLSDRPPGY